MIRYKKVSIILIAAIASIIPYSAFAVDTSKVMVSNNKQIISNDKESNIVADNNELDNTSKIDTSDTDMKYSGVNFGWKKNNDGTYSLFDSKGNMVKSDWCKVDGKWYYFNDSGIIQNGWIKYDGGWFYLDSNGNPKTGWTSLGQTWYYLDNSGKMQIGWHNINGKWYYFNNKGEMLTGWQKINSKWYYFDHSGKMLSNTVIDGYTLGPNGFWI